MDCESQYLLWISFGHGFGYVASDPVIVQNGKVHGDSSTSPISPMNSDKGGLGCDSSTNNETHSVRLHGWGMHPELSNVDKMIDFAFTFNGNLYSLRWIVSLISADAQRITPPIVHDLHPWKFWMTPNGGKVVSFCLEILDDILRSMIMRKVKVYLFRVGFIDHTEMRVDNIPVLSAVITFTSKSILRRTARNILKKYRIVPSE